MSVFSDVLWYTEQIYFAKLEIVLLAKPLHLIY